jgi:hypothetical protein
MMVRQLGHGGLVRGMCEAFDQAKAQLLPVTGGRRGLAVMLNNNLGLPDRQFEPF